MARIVLNILGILGCPRKGCGSTGYLSEGKPLEYCQTPLDYANVAL